MLNSADLAKIEQQSPLQLPIASLEHVLSLYQASGLDLKKHGAPNGTWNQHGDLKRGHEKNALDTDHAIAGRIKDLKSRGLLDETLLLWASDWAEPRTPPDVMAAITIGKASASSSLGAA